MLWLLIVLGIIGFIFMIWSACAAGPRNTPKDDIEQMRCIKEFYNRKGKKL